jgi:hypothetical protein
MSLSECHSLKKGNGIKGLRLSLVIYSMGNTHISHHAIMVCRLAIMSRCWRKPILGKIKEVLKESRQRRKIEEK